MNGLSIRQNDLRPTRLFVKTYTHFTYERMEGSGTNIGTCTKTYMIVCAPNQLHVGVHAYCRLFVMPMYVTLDKQLLNNNSTKEGYAFIKVFQQNLIFHIQAGWWLEAQEGRRCARDLGQAVTSGRRRGIGQ